MLFSEFINAITTKLIALTTNNDIFFIILLIIEVFEAYTLAKINISSNNFQQFVSYTNRQAYILHNFK